MNIVLTGSLGNISKSLAQDLVQKGHSVTVISSNPEKQRDIEALKAKAAIGKLEDINFLASTFAGAEAVYCMLDGEIAIIRPAAFYTNFYFSMDLIKGKGIIGKYLKLRYSGLKALLAGKTGLLMGNYGGDDKIIIVSPKDLAEAVAEESKDTTFSFGIPGFV